MFLAPFMTSLTLRKIIVKVKMSLGDLLSSQIAYSPSRQAPRAGICDLPTAWLRLSISFGGWMI